MRKETFILVLILLVHLFLGVYGINWGLPDRWNVDEQTANTLRFISLRSPFSVIDIAHPQLYNFVLAVPLSIYLIVLKCISYPLDTVAAAASKSWMHLAAAAPGFATGAYIVSRTFSVFLGIIAIILTYKIAKLIYDKKVALFSAAIFSTSLALIETSHFAKHTALVLPLVLLVLYLCIKGLESANFRRNILLASFVCGLSVATKLDGAISIIFIISSYILWMRKFKPGAKEQVRVVFICSGLFILGFFIGWPALLKNASVYLNSKTTMGGIPQLDSSLFYVFAKKIYYNIRHSIVMFGLPMALFVYAGIMHLIFRFKKYPYGCIFAAVLIPYFLLNIVYFTDYPGAYTKLLIQAVPILSILAGYIMVNMLNWNRFSKVLKVTIISIVFLLTFSYAFRADTVFAHNDTRYKATEWILNNIPKTASIEHVQRVNVLFSTKITRLYNVLFYGRSSNTFAGDSFYKLDDNAEAVQYINRLNREGSYADYFIVAFGNDFKRDLAEMPKAAEQQFCYRLLKNKVNNFRLVQRFYYPESLVFNPRPSYTAPDIHIFKRVQAE